MEEDLGVEGAVLEGMLDPKEGTEEDMAKMEGLVVAVDAAEVTEGGAAGAKEV
jgi:hypothetical protein